MNDKMFVNVGHMWIAIAKIEKIIRVQMENGPGFHVFLEGRDEAVVIHPFAAPGFEEWLNRHSLA